MPTWAREGPPFRWPPFNDEETQPASTPPPKAHADIAGDDGAKLERLIITSIKDGAAELWDITKTALRGYKGIGPLLTQVQLKQVATRIGGVRSGAELLGRGRVHEMAERALEAGGLSKFAEDDPFTVHASDFPDIIKAPKEALDYFANLIPKLGIDPERWLGEQSRRAFTLAESVNQVLTTKVQDIIREGIRNGEGVADATAKITRQLESAGVNPKNPQYSEMVFRTNVVDSYQTGVYQEGRNPEIAGIFPVWKYVGIRDGRQGKDHEPRFDKFYPSTAPFADVRGNRPYNCRCSLQWIDYMDWQLLQSSGAQVERHW